jgi:hypothetical protein
MTVKHQSEKEEMGIKCHRCNGRMASEKFYGEDNAFFGWHCVSCGEILDPVILLHRLSQDPAIAIPDKEEEIMSLIKRYKSARPQSSMNCKPS